MREIFLSHSVTTLKKEISKTNIKGYSTMKKAQIVDLMVKNQARFSHIKLNEKIKLFKKKTEPKKKMPSKTEPPKKKQRLIVKKKPTPKNDTEPPRPSAPPAPPAPPKKNKKKYEFQEFVKKDSPKTYKTLTKNYKQNKKLGKEYANKRFKQELENYVKIHKPELLKAKERKKERKKTEANIKKQELPQLMAIAGLTKKQANKLDPAALFGLLPSELSKKILNPKETGIKVAQNRISNESLNNSVKEILKIKNPNIKIDSEKGRLEGNKIYSNIIKNIKFYLPKGRDWRKGKFGPELEKELNTPEQAKIVLQGIVVEKRNAKIENQIKNTKIRITAKMKNDLDEKYEDERLSIFGKSVVGNIVYSFEIIDSNANRLIFAKTNMATGKRQKQKLLMTYKEFFIKVKEGYITKIKDLTI